MPKFARRLLAGAWLLLLFCALTVVPAWQADRVHEREQESLQREHGVRSDPRYRHCLREHDHHVRECRELRDALLN